MNLSIHLTSIYHTLFGELPSSKQLFVIKETTDKLCTPYTQQYEHLLQQIHALSGINETYRKVGDVWQTIGFQSEDPTSDIRGGGVLSLENLIYFLENDTISARKMMMMRSKRDNRPNNQVGGYPWAACGINVTRTLAIIFEMIQQSGAKNKIFSRKSYWNILEAKNSFNRMYVLLFQLLDFLWGESNATYLDFPKIMLAAQEEFVQLLTYSNNLHDLENRVYARVHHIDDYSSLPDANLSESDYVIGGNDESNETNYSFMCMSSTSSTVSHTNSNYSNSYYKSQMPNFIEDFDIIAETSNHHSHFHNNANYKNIGNSGMHHQPNTNTNTGGNTSREGKDSSSSHVVRIAPKSMVNGNSGNLRRRHIPIHVV